MLEKKQDSTNSRREFAVGGYGFENPFNLIREENTLHVGFSDTYSFFYQSGESGVGHFGVGMNPMPDSGQKWYNTIVSDHVVEKSGKFDFYSTLAVNNQSYPYGPPFGISVSTTPNGRFLRTQYYESHLITGSVSQGAGITQIYFTEVPRRNGIFYVPNCEARAYRLLANVNGIQRNSGTQSKSFSAYWDLVFGIKNFQYCYNGSMQSIATSPNYLSQVSRSSFLSTGTIGITSETPYLSVDILGDDQFTISVVMTGNYNMIGSAKLTTTDSAYLVSSDVLPV
jgi:hypothetical protein